MTETEGITFVGPSQKRSLIIIRNADGSIYSPSAKKSFTEPAPSITNQETEWAKWGPNNDLPKEYVRFMENAGVLPSSIDMIARIAVGRGPRPVLVSEDAEGNETIKIINDPEINQWLSDNNIKTFAYETILDALETGHTFSQLLSNRARNRINRIKRSDAYLCRFARRSKSGKINHVYISHEWGKIGAATNDETMAKVPLLDKDNPVADLQDENGDIKSLPAEFAIASHYRLRNRQYYAVPLWYAVRAWIEIAISVPAMKAQLFNNQMTIKYVIAIDDKYWENRWKGWNGFTADEREQKRKSVLEGLDAWLSGNENAGKSLIIGTRTDPVTGAAINLIQVEAVDDKIQDGKFLPDSASANSEILFAMALNPALLGVDMPGGMYGGGKGGSNIREAFLVQILIREREREFVTNPLNVVAKVNGWTDRHPGMQWRFPNQYLTTLDSGKNAKPIT